MRLKLGFSFFIGFASSFGLKVAPHGRSPQFLVRLFPANTTRKVLIFYVLGGHSFHVLFLWLGVRRIMGSTFTAFFTAFQLAARARLCVNPDILNPARFFLAVLSSSLLPFNRFFPCNTSRCPGAHPLVLCFEYSNFRRSSFIVDHLCRHRRFLLLFFNGPIFFRSTIAPPFPPLPIGFLPGPLSRTSWIFGNYPYVLQVL